MAKPITHALTLLISLIGRAEDRYVSELFYLAMINTTHPLAG